MWHKKDIEVLAIKSHMGREEGGNIRAGGKQVVLGLLRPLM